MSLDARNLTQGGQVIKYMVAMFMQIANIVAFWVIMVIILVFFAIIAFQIPFKKMIHGLSYLGNGYTGHPATGSDWHQRRRHFYLPLVKSLNRPGG